MIIAETMVGNGDQAFDYYTRLNPSAREQISEVHRCEPYVYAQMIAGPDAATPGEAKNSWLSGTAAWSYVAITQWILGIRPDFDGLRVDPVLPDLAGLPGDPALPRCHLRDQRDESRPACAAGCAARGGRHPGRRNAAAAGPRARRCR